MRVLVTNDDGIEAPGLAALTAGLSADGHDVFIVAPVADSSGAGAATGAQRRDRRERVGCVPTQIGGLPAYGLEALPALCVLAACAGAFGPAPEAVVAGINAGRNVGRSVLHSGTVGAALAGAQHGIAALAVSVQVRAGVPTSYDDAVVFARRLLPLAGELAGTALSCNLPGVAPGKIRGLRWARVGNAGLIAEAILDGDAVEFRFRRGQAGDAGTDESLTDNDYATLSALRGIGADPGVAARYAAELAAIERGILTGEPAAP